MNLARKREGGTSTAWSKRRGLHFLSVWAVGWCDTSSTRSALLSLPLVPRPRSLEIKKSVTCHEYRNYLWDLIRSESSARRGNTPSAMNEERKMPRWARILLIVLGTPIAVILGVLVVFVVALPVGPTTPKDADGIARAIIDRKR